MSRRCRLLWIATLLTASTAGAADRTFTLTTAAVVTGLRPGQHLAVWVPVPPTDATQQVDIAPSALPTVPDDKVEPRYGNRMLHFDVAAVRGTSLSMTVNFRVTRHPVTQPSAACPAVCDPAALLRPDAKVPVGGRPGELLVGRVKSADATAAAQLAFDLTDDRLAYRKDRPGWGSGDATLACDSRFGNCTDFSSLFISLCRTQQVPAVFQIGFPIGPAVSGTVGGYHCWAWYQTPNRHWAPVDVADANQHPDRRPFDFGHLDADRVAMTVGRDLELVPKQAGPPLNFFVHPYVEADGKPVPPGQIADRVTFDR